MVDLFARTDAIARERPLTEAEEGGLIQFFEVSVELGWKTLALALRESGVLLLNLSPVTVLREAARVGLIDDPDRWMAAVERRNMMSHTYDPDAFRELVADAAAMFLPMMMQLRTTLSQPDAT